VRSSWSSGSIYLSVCQAQAPASGIPDVPGALANLADLTVTVNARNPSRVALVEAEVVAAFKGWGLEVMLGRPEEDQGLRVSGLGFRASPGGSGQTSKVQGKP
jgi:hypothetical protein